jgi:hypothetical protein
MTPPPERVAQLVARVPTATRAQLADALWSLATLGPLVIAALERISPLTDAAEAAIEHPASGELVAPPTDAEWGAVIDQLGIGALHTWADRIAAAHPQHTQGVT